MNYFVFFIVKGIGYLNKDFYFDEGLINKMLFLLIY